MGPVPLLSLFPGAARADGGLDQAVVGGDGTKGMDSGDLRVVPGPILQM